MSDQINILPLTDEQKRACEQRMFQLGKEISDLHYARSQLQYIKKDQKTEEDQKGMTQAYWGCQERFWWINHLKNVHHGTQCFTQMPNSMVNTIAECTREIFPKKYEYDQQKGQVKDMTGYIRGIIEKR